MSTTETCRHCGRDQTLDEPLPAYVTHYVCPDCQPKLIEWFDKIERTLIRSFDEMGYHSFEEQSRWVAVGREGQFDITEITSDIIEGLLSPLQPLPQSATPEE